MNEIVKKNGITYGVYTAGLFVGLLVLMYVIDLSLFTKWYMTVIQLIAIPVIGVFAVRNTKSELNNFISFKDAFTTYFIMILIGLTVSTLGTILLFNVIDPSAKEVITEHLMKTMKEMFEKFNMPSSEIKKALNEIKKQDSFSISNILTNLPFSIIGYSIIGLIIAAIFKSKSQEEKY